jgi:MarR family transcriptional regulator, organic hydroperoxide resistance regulator
VKAPAPRSDAAPGLFSPGFGAWIKIGVVYQKTSRHLAKLLRPLDLTVAQFDALANLFVGDGISQGELASRLLVTKGNMTGLVSRLEERGLVAREPDPHDGRAHRLRLTGPGRRLAKRALVIQKDLVDATMGGLSARERELLRGLLGRVATDVDRLAPPAGNGQGSR